MVVTNLAKSNLALRMVNQGTYPQYCAIGTGSGVPLASVGSLFTETGTRAAYTTLSTGVANKVTFTYDFSSVTMSGISLREFGIGPSGTVNQDLWNHEDFLPVVFDGSNELAVEITFEVF